MLESYKELTVWQKAINLVEEVYKLTAEFPKDELYGLVNQMRRASVSIPSNVAEGSRRKDLPEYLHFLRISDGLASELETQVIIARRLYPELKYTRVEGLLLEIQKMLNVLIIRLELKVRERA